MFLTDFCKLWDNFQEVFLVLFVVVVLPHWRFLHFQATFLCHQHSTLVSHVGEGLHQLWALHWLLLVALLLPDFSVTVNHECYAFERAFLLTGVFLPSTPSPLSGTFCNSDVGRNTPSRILLCACPHKIILSGWRMVLSYSCCE